MNEPPPDYSIPARMQNAHHNVNSWHAHFNGMACTSYGWVTVQRMLYNSINSKCMLHREGDLHKHRALPNIKIKCMQSDTNRMFMNYELLAVMYLLSLVQHPGTWANNPHH